MVLQNSFFFSPWGKKNHHKTLFSFNYMYFTGTFCCIGRSEQTFIKKQECSSLIQSNTIFHAGDHSKPTTRTKMNAGNFLLVI